MRIRSYFRSFPNLNLNPRLLARPEPYRATTVRECPWPCGRPKTMKTRKWTASSLCSNLPRVAILADHPCRHAPLILDNRRLQGVEQPASELSREPVQQRFIDQIPPRAVGQQEAAALDPFHLVLHANRGGEPAK